MLIKTYHINAFVDSSFSGNPAMVCILPEWLPEKTLQLIATENNLPATAFLMNKLDNYETRWFTPEYEIDLCGHGLLASAYVIFKILKTSKNEVEIKYPSGILKLKCTGNNFTLNLPSKDLTSIPITDLIIKGLGLRPKELYAHKNERCLAIFESEQEIKVLNPDMNIFKKLDYRGVIVSALGNTADFVSRTFYPKKKDFEDAVTGSSHCLLAPYWSNQLQNTKLHAKQLSKQGGNLFCEYLGKSINITGTAVLYMQGEIILK